MRSWVNAAIQIKLRPELIFLFFSSFAQVWKGHRTLTCALSGECITQPSTILDMTCALTCHMCIKCLRVIELLRSDIAFRYYKLCNYFMNVITQSHILGLSIPHQPHPGGKYCLGQTENSAPTPSQSIRKINLYNKPHGSPHSSSHSCVA